MGVVLFGFGIKVIGCKYCSWPDMIAFGLAAVFLVFVPFLDRRSRDGRNSPLFTAIAVAGVLYLVVFTILAQLAP